MIFIGGKPMVGKSKSVDPSDMDQVINDFTQHVMERLWNKCMYCGQFIAHEDFDTGRAESKMVTPDSALTQEDIHVYHVKCKEEA